MKKLIADFIYFIIMYLFILFYYIIGITLISYGLCEIIKTYSGIFTLKHLSDITIISVGIYSVIAGIIKQINN